jgi:mercuric ion binding protein
MNTHYLCYNLYNYKMKKIFGMVILSSIFIACGQPEKQVQVKNKVEKNEPEVKVIANKTIDLQIEGMVCEMGCGSSIRKALKDTKAVDRCSFDFKDERKVNTATISFDSTAISQDKIVSIISQLNDKQFKVN